mgnify:CR=1 FL=1
MECCYLGSSRYKMGAAVREICRDIRSYLTNCITYYRLHLPLWRHSTLNIFPWAIGGDGGCASSVLDLVCRCSDSGGMVTSTILQSQRYSNYLLLRLFL